MCNELIHNDYVIVKHDLIYYLFFFIMCRFFRSKIHIVNVLFIYIRKSKEKNYTYEKFMFCFKVKHISLY